MEEQYLIEIRKQVNNLTREEYLFNPETKRILKTVEELLKACEYIEAIDKRDDERIKKQVSREMLSSSDGKFDFY